MDTLVFTAPLEFAVVVVSSTGSENSHTSTDAPALKPSARKGTTAPVGPLVTASVTSPAELGTGVDVVVVDGAVVEVVDGALVVVVVARGALVVVVEVGDAVVLVVAGNVVVVDVLEDVVGVVVDDVVGVVVEVVVDDVVGVVVQVLDVDVDVLDDEVDVLDVEVVFADVVVVVVGGGPAAPAVQLAASAVRVILTFQYLSSWAGPAGPCVQAMPMLYVPAGTWPGSVNTMKSNAGMLRIGPGPGAGEALAVCWLTTGVPKVSYRGWRKLAPVAPGIGPLAPKVRVDGSTASGTMYVCHRQPPFALSPAHAALSGSLSVKSVSLSPAGRGARRLGSTIWASPAFVVASAGARIVQPVTTSISTDAMTPARAAMLRIRRTATLRAVIEAPRSPPTLARAAPPTVATRSYQRRTRPSGGRPPPRPAPARSTSGRRRAPPQVHEP